MKLNLGSGNDEKQGYLNYDREVDLNKKLKFKDNSIEEVLLYHVLEHLNDPEFTIEELDRILKKDGVLKVKLPINTVCFEHKRYRHGFGYFYKLIQTGRYELVRVEARRSKWGNPFKDMLQRFKTWVYNNIFLFNEIYWELKKK